MFQSSIDSKYSPDWRDSMRRVGKKLQCDFTYSESQGSNPILRLRHAQILLFKNTNTNINTHTDPILRLRHAQILLFTPFFLRNICNGGWIWLLWKENVAIRISFHLSLEVEGFNLYNLQTYCESFTPLVKSIPDLGLKRGYRKGKKIGYDINELHRDAWRYIIFLTTQIPKLFLTDLSKGWCWFGV